MNLLDSKIFTVKSANDNAETNTNEKPESEHYKKYMKRAKLMNNLAKVAFIGFLVIFNIIFWIVAINEYVKPAEDYITDSDNVQTWKIALLVLQTDTKHLLNKQN